MSGRSAAELYENDFFAWTQLQAKELRRFARSRPNLPLDLAHIAEEIADLGKEQRNALRSWTARIIEHLLLLEHSPTDDLRRGWIDELVNFRREIELRMTPTLRRDLARHCRASTSTRAGICKGSSRSTTKGKPLAASLNVAPTHSTRSSVTRGLRWPRR
jgi:hypothetical protein